MPAGPSGAVGRFPPHGSGVCPEGIPSGLLGGAPCRSQTPLRQTRWCAIPLTAGGSNATSRSSSGGAHRRPSPRTVRRLDRTLAEARIVAGRLLWWTDLAREPPTHPARQSCDPPRGPRLMPAPSATEIRRRASSIGARPSAGSPHWGAFSAGGRIKNPGAKRLAGRSVVGSSHRPGGDLTPARIIRSRATHSAASGRAASERVAESFAVPPIRLSSMLRGAAPCLPPRPLGAAARRHRPRPAGPVRGNA